MKRIKEIKYLLFISFDFLTFSSGEAQESKGRGLIIKNPTTQKEKLIKEHKLIRIKTAEGKKVKGKFTIYNSDTIYIRNIPYAIDEISKIKRNPLLQTVLIDGFLISSGVATILSGVFLGVFFILP